MTELPPTVSVIVCTYNRPDLVHRALDSVRAQDRRDFEIIVVDDGSDPPVALLPHERASVRLIRTEHQGPGSARSQGLNAARGEFTAYCDDDDLWRPDHLSTLLSYLRNHPEVDLVYGDSEWADASAAGAVAYSIDHEAALLAECNSIFASDVLHRTRVAREVGGFDSALTAFEDWDLWLRLSLGHTLRHLPVVVGEREWQAGGVSATDHWNDWEKVYRAHQERLGRAGPAARHGLVTAPHGSAPGSGRSEGRRLTWYSLLRPQQGYGSVGRQLLLAVERQGVEVRMAPTNDQPPRGFERFFAPPRCWNPVGFYYHYWVQPSVLRCARIVNYSMWESSAVPREHVEEINRHVALQYVPCRQNVESFRACGVRVPIKVLHHGVDADCFPRLERPRRGHFTFGTFGDLSPRKGIDLLIRAFREEFPRKEPVRLLLKTSSPLRVDTADDPRIQTVSGYMKPAVLLEFLRALDAFVLPSRGEGFGLCGLEALATGLPLVATNWGGPAEYLDPADTFPLGFRLVEAGGVESNHVRYHGCWAEPDQEHLRHLMRWIFEHPEKAQERGSAAADRVREHWGWDRVARQLCRDLDEMARE